MMLGRESLVLQGYPVDRIEASSLKAFGDHFLQDLAGNAYPGTCVAALFIVSMTRAPWAGLRRRISDEADAVLLTMIGLNGGSLGDDQVEECVE